MKVGEKTNFGRLATIFQIFSMDADMLADVVNYYHKRKTKKMDSCTHVLLYMSKRPG